MKYEECKLKLVLMGYSICIGHCDLSVDVHSLIIILPPKLLPNSRMYSAQGFTIYPRFLRPNKNKPSMGYSEVISTVLTWERKHKAK